MPDEDVLEEGGLEPATEVSAEPEILRLLLEEIRDRHEGASEKSSYGSVDRELWTAQQAKDALAILERLTLADKLIIAPGESEVSQ